MLLQTFSFGFYNLQENEVGYHECQLGQCVEYCAEKFDNVVELLLSSIVPDVTFSQFPTADSDVLEVREDLQQLPTDMGRE